MISKLFSLWTIITCLPILAKRFGFMTPDFVPLDENGQTYVQGVSTGEPVYTRQAPNDEATYFSLAACAVAVYNFFN